MKIILGILLGTLLLLRGGSSYVFSANSFTERPYVKIIEIKEENHFGGIFEFVLSVGTPDEQPVMVSFYIEGLTEKKEIIFYGNNTEYVLPLLFELPPFGDDGSYELVVEGFGQEDRGEVMILNRRACTFFNDDFELELSPLGESMVNVSLFNKGDNSSFEIWPEKYKASQLQRFFLSSGEVWETEIHLKNKSETFRVNAKNAVTGRYVTMELEHLGGEFAVDSKHYQVQIFNSPSRKASDSGIYIFTFVLVLVCILVIIQRFK